MAPKTIQSSVAFQDPQGNVLANGSINFDLNTPSEVIGGGQVVPTRVTVNLTSAGVIPAATTIWANDQLNPGNTLYIVTIHNANGLVVEGPVFWSITGTSPIDLSQVTPVSNATLSFSLPGINEQTFPTSGTFTIPAGVTKLKVTIVGGGGAGGGGGATAAMGAGGGAGGCGIAYLTGLTPGNTITVTAGVGGTGVSGATGNSGTASSISSGTQTISTVTANGGAGGIGNTIGLNGGGAGGTVSGATLTLGGASGPPAISTSIAATNGAPSVFGGGGQASGNGGNAPGSGGAGNNSNPGTGGSGANGVVTFEWIA